MTLTVNIPTPDRTYYPEGVVVINPDTGAPVSPASGALLQNTLTNVATATVVFTSSSTNKPSIWTHSATVTGTNDVSATVLIEASNDGTSWFPLCTLSPTGSTSAIDAITGISAALNVRHRCTAISGTDASVTVTSSGA